jgi:hypothetical protein
MPCQSQPSWLDNSNYIWRWVQVIKLLITHFSPISSHFSTHSNTLQHPVIRYHILTLYCFLGSVGIATGYRLDCRGSFPGRGKIFLFSTSSRSALGPTQPPIQLEPELFAREQSGQGLKLTTHLHLVPRSRTVNPDLHFPICLHGIVFNWLSTRKSLPHVISLKSQTKVYTHTIINLYILHRKKYVSDF